MAEGGWRSLLMGEEGKGVASDIVDGGGHGLWSNILQGLYSVDRVSDLGGLHGWES